MTVDKHDATTGRSRAVLSEEERQEMNWHLIVVHSEGEIAPQHPFQRRLVVGRAKDCHLSGEDASLSRQHGEIVERSPGRFVVRDNGSRNGTFVNKIRVQGEVELEPFDVVRFGDTVCVVAEGPLEPKNDDDPTLVGRSHALGRAKLQIDLAATTTRPVLILGETGTGKEATAARVHRLSGRPGRLVCVNCSAVASELAESYYFGHRRGAFTGAASDSEGAFVAARGGTLFLDEVGDMPEEQQPKLLRALDSGEVTKVGGTHADRVECRIVAATNKPLARAVEQGTFRADLYARLAGSVVLLPPLRERREDVLILFKHMWAALTPEPPKLDPLFVEALLVHDWPLNVRELRRVVESLAHRPSETLRPSSLAVVLSTSPAPGRSAPQRQVPVIPREGPDRELMVQLMTEHGGNVAKVAETLGRQRLQIYRWLRRLGLDAETFRIK